MATQTQTQTQPPAPTPTPYNRQNSTASGIAADLSSSIAGKVVLTTGVSPNGLGAHFVETIASHKPALLILAGRSESKLRATAAKIASISNVPTRLLILDLSSQSQIRAAAKEVLAYPEPAIDVLVNSAGIMAGPYSTTSSGIELQFGSNHIGHFLFTNLVMPKLLSSPTTPGPRIVNVSSDGHRLSPIRFTSINFDNGRTYNQWLAYGQSKTANILFSKSLAEKLGGRGVRAYSLHPGVAFGTSLAGGELGESDFADLSIIDKEIGDPLGEDDAVFDVKTLDECAATHVVAAFDPRIDEYNGAYLENGNISNDVRPTAANPGDVEKLWKLSEELVGQKFEY
ncbi:WW domain-containing oxidoreductase [Clohesyomyces aquaticus]|uniref:WW domain-containing oxidoreductase n=1 Tax=Clohesyomyces aquaticus TaxID=1231657 RepID=A0A1Y1ZR26_9PLEO|nr:WW domain-containing oxidoreductase [Clohesyomyces aquaticus]